MSAPITLKPKEIDVSSITLHENKIKNPKTSNVKTYSLKYDGAGLEIITPKMVAPFGIGNNSALNKDSSNVKWSIQLSFKGEDDDTDEGRKIKELKTKLLEIQDKIKKIYLKNWADINDPIPDGSKHDERTMSMKFRSCIKESKSKTGVKYPDNIRITIPWNKDANCPRDEVEFFNSKKELKEYTDVIPYSKVRSIIRITGISFTQLGVNFSLKLVQLKFYAPEIYKPVKGLRIQDDSESDNEDNDEESVEEEIEEEESVEEESAEEDE